MAKAFMQAYSQAVASTFFFLSALMFWYLNLCTDAGKGGQEAAKPPLRQSFEGGEWIENKLLIYLIFPHHLLPSMKYCRFVLHLPFVSSCLMLRTFDCLAI